MTADEVNEAVAMSFPDADRDLQVTDRQLDAIRVLWRDLAARWGAVEQGATLELVFPARAAAL